MHRGTIGADGGLERLETITVDRHFSAAAPAIGGGYVLADRACCSSMTQAKSRNSRSPSPSNRQADERRGVRPPRTPLGRNDSHDESPATGARYRLELDGSCTTVLTGLTISDGLG